MAATNEPNEPNESSRSPENDIVLESEVTITDLDVRGTLPRELSGQLLAIGPDDDGGGRAGKVHSVLLHEGRALSYRSRWIVTDAVAHRLGREPVPGPRIAGDDAVHANIIVFNGSILALGHHSLAYELTRDLVTLRRVDLAGRSRTLDAYPTRDPTSGDLHVLADDDGSLVHVVVSTGAQTRTSRPITGTSRKIDGLAITRDRVVFVGEGCVGVTTRGRETHPVWISTGVDAARLLAARDAQQTDDTVVAYTTTPSLERWTLHIPTASMRREVVDPAPQRFARSIDQSFDPAPRYLWTSSGWTLSMHDLVTRHHLRRAFPLRQPGDFVFVPNAIRRNDLDGGWLVGFVHQRTRAGTELVVLNAADITLPALATVRLPSYIPEALRCTWVPTPGQ